MIKKQLLPIVLVLVITTTVAGYFYFSSISVAQKSTSSSVNQELTARFNYLAKNGNTNCSKIFTESISSMSDNARLQGSCCSPMVLQRYTEQISGLKKYKDISQIPSDPYDLPAKLAKELLSYNQTIKPTAEEQKILDQGEMASEEKGFCCCKCWRWDAHEGMSKFLVRNNHFNSKQISELLDLQDGCGGGENHA